MTKVSCLSDKWNIQKLLLKDSRGKISYPDVQRDFVWTKPQMQLLIDSIIRGYDLPKIYLRKNPDDPTQFHVYDGQQRITTLKKFANGEFPLAHDSDDIKIDGAEYELAGKEFEELNEDVIVEFNNFSIDVVFMEDFTEKDSDEMFYRLQQGTSLNPAEKRRALQSNMKRVVTVLSDHAIFTKNGFVIFSSNRFGFEDATAKILHQFINNGIVSISAAKIVKTYMENTAITEQHRDVKRVKKAMNFIEKCFTRTTPPGLRKFSYLSLMTVVDEFVRNYNISDFKNEFAKIYLDFEEKRITERLELPESDQDPVLVEYNSSARGDSVGNMEYRVKTLKDLFLDKIPKLEMKDPQRLFNDDQKRVLFWRSGGKCQKCSCKIAEDNFHADHILAHSRGGKTVIENGRALCPDCNLSLGAGNR